VWFGGGWPGRFGCAIADLFTLVWGGLQAMDEKLTAWIQGGEGRVLRQAHVNEMAAGVRQNAGSRLFS
jgi:hypothetical protein